MNEAFLKLDSEKRERILQAAYEEFTEHSYDNASTNRIVKKAKIGKGMLFYYFGNKEDLFHYLIDYGLDFIQEGYLGKLEQSTHDFIERCKLLGQEKMAAYAKAPYIIDFFAKVYINNQLNELPLGIAEKREQMMQLAYNQLYANLDYSLFREDIPHGEAMKMIKWIFDGYEKELTNQLKDIDISYENVLPFLDEYEDFLEIIKRTFYK